ncbi:MAG: hypothetical protein WBA22_10140 [Candidatus Methanofastidiosia archaeon]
MNKDDLEMETPFTEKKTATGEYKAPYFTIECTDALFNRAPYSVSHGSSLLEVWNLNEKRKKRTIASINGLFALYRFEVSKDSKSPVFVNTVEVQPGETYNVASPTVSIDLQRGVSAHGTYRLLYCTGP